MEPIEPDQPPAAELPAQAVLAKGNLGQESHILEKPEPPKEEPIPQKPKKKNSNLKILSITFAAILAISIIVKLFGSQTTGYVSYEVNKVPINEMAYKASLFQLLTKEKMPINSAKLSGSIIGNGSVKVYLTSANEKKLVFTNVKEKTLLPLITGFSVKKIENSDQASGSHLTADLDNIELSGDKNNVLTGIKLKEIGNQQGVNIEKVKVSWLANNGEKISGIKISGWEFWGYNKAGAPLGAQASGTLLKAWAQKLPENAVRNVDEVVFDSDMSDKQLNIELYFNDYLGGFRLGEERLLKLYLDLSGKTESYVEEDNKKVQKLVIERSPEAIKPSSPKTQDNNSQQATQIQLNPPPKALSNATNATAELPKQTEAINNSFAPESTLGEPSKQKEITTFSPASKNSTNIQLKIYEEPRYKEIFEAAKPNSTQKITGECSETCILDNVNLNDYHFEFEIDPGTAINVTDVDFS